MLSVKLLCCLFWILSHSFWSVWQWWFALMYRYMAQRPEAGGLQYSSGPVWTDTPFQSCSLNAICTSYSPCQVYCLTQTSAISFTESSTQLHHLHGLSSATCLFCTLFWVTLCSMVRIWTGDKNGTGVPTITTQFLTYNFYFELLHRAIVCGR